MASGKTKQGEDSKERLASQEQSVGSIKVTGSSNQVIIQQNSDGEGRNSDVSRNDVPATAEASLSTGWTWFFGIAFALITLLALPVLVNLLTGQNPLPGWLQAIVPYSAPLIGASLFLLGVLFLWQTRLQRRGAMSPGGLAQRDRIELPSRDTLLTKSRNIHQQSEDDFEREVDVQLGIQRVPQLVAAQHLPHIAARGTTAARPLTEPLVDYLLRVEKLLLVGAPGAGKSATLRTLWGEILARAQSDPGLPVPFLLNLSTFSRYSGTFRSWLAESLRECAGMPLAIGQVLLQRGQLFLLLDGLDEMTEARRAAALKELNELLVAADPALGRCIVCSRTLEYEQSGVVLRMPAALELQPLTAAQVREAVANAGLATQPLAVALERDPALAELLVTPLLLTVAARTYAGNPHLVLSGQSPIELRRALFDAYIGQMLRRSSIRTMKPTHRLLRCLLWLALHLTNEQSTLLLMERMQPTLLRVKLGYKMVRGLVVGLAIGLGSWLVAGLAAGLADRLFEKLVPWLVVGLVVGLVAGSAVGLVFGQQALRIEPVEQMRWSWSQWITNWQGQRRRNLTYGPIVGLVAGLVVGLGYRVEYGVFFWLVLGLVLGLIDLFSLGWGKSLTKESNQPNQGIYASIRHGVTEGMLAGLVSGPTLVLGFGLVFGLERELVGGLSIGLAGGLAAALRGGLGEAIKHYVLRVFLRFEVGLPLRLVPFLEQCRRMLLLRREGGGYRFWHVTLQEHFAALDSARMNDIAERSLAKDAYQSKY